MPDVIALSHAFVSHWNRCDIDAVIGALSEDVVYQNVPLPAMHGRAAVRAFITPNLKRVTRMNWVVHNFAVTADGGDFTVHIIVGLDPEGRMFVLDLWRQQ